MPLDAVLKSMRCHYCDAEAAYAPESHGIRVGLCDLHLKVFVSTCSEQDLPAALGELDS